MRDWIQLTVRHSDDFDPDELCEVLEAAGVEVIGYGLPGTGFNLFTGKMTRDDPDCITLDLEEDTATAREIIARHGGEVVATEKRREGGAGVGPVLAYLSIAAASGYGAYTAHGWTRIGLGAVAALCAAAGLWTAFIVGGLTLLLRFATRAARRGQN